MPVKTNFKTQPALTVNGSAGAWVSFAFPQGCTGFSIKEAGGLEYRVSSDGGVTSFKKDGAIEWLEDGLLISNSRLIYFRMEGVGAGSLHIHTWQ